LFKTQITFKPFYDYNTKLELKCSDFKNDFIDVRVSNLKIFRIYIYWQ